MVPYVICSDVLCFNSDVPMPFTSAGQPDKPVFLSSKETSSIIVEKKDEVTASLGASSSSRMIDSSSRSMHDAADAAVQSTDVMAAAAAAATTSAAADASKTAVNMTRVVCIYVCLNFHFSDIVDCVLQ